MIFGFDEHFILIVHDGICEISLLQVLIPTEHVADGGGGRGGFWTYDAGDTIKIIQIQDCD